MSTNVDSDTLGLMGSPGKVRRRVVGRISCFTKGGLYNWVVCLKITIRECLFYGKKKFGSNHTVKFPKGTWHHIKSRERRGPSRFKSVNLTRRNLAPRKMRPQSSVELGEVSTGSKSTDKANCYSPAEARAMLAPTSKISRGTRIRGRLWSINAHAEQKRSELKRTGYPSKVQECGNGIW